MNRDDLPTPHILAATALITGAFLSMAVFTLAVLVHWVKPWAWGLSAFAFISALAWLGLMAWWRRLLEGIHGIEPKPAQIIEQSPRIIVMDETDKGYSQGWILDDLPGGEGKFARLAAGVMNGEPLAERYWTGSQGPYSLSEFRDLRDYLLLRGFFNWRSEADHRQGIDIQPVGRAMIRRYANLLDGPSPIVEGRYRE